MKGYNETAEIHDKLYTASSQEPQGQFQPNMVQSVLAFG